ncbi:hypothetical protein DXG03_008868 [Asterophora parasitica]|uniref:Uncharacterized protein n=1 Tax=Asterophora parasitica TaxID=117018 RepID=A0A9P7KCT6_9AGAR|nr:hypothetical protein DXG03_008868 [Asterophora parasitica]
MARDTPGSGVSIDIATGESFRELSPQDDGTFNLWIQGSLLESYIPDVDPDYDVEFKLLKWPEFSPATYTPLFHETLYQAAKYLAGCEIMCATRLAMAVINTCFMRLFLLDRHTLAVEIPEHLVAAAQERQVSTIQDLERWDAFWVATAHNYFPKGELDHEEFNVLWETVAQGHYFAAMEGEIPDINLTEESLSPSRIANAGSASESDLPARTTSRRKRRPSSPAPGSPPPTKRKRASSVPLATDEPLGMTTPLLPPLPRPNDTPDFACHPAIARWSVPVCISIVHNPNLEIEGNPIYNGCCTSEISELTRISRAANCIDNRNLSGSLPPLSDSIRIQAEFVKHSKREFVDVPVGHVPKIRHKTWADTKC